MRSPHQHLIKQNCIAVIPAVFEKYQLGKVHSISQDMEGWVNPCFFVNDEYVIRFNARDIELPKYKREVFAFENLKNSPIPVPNEYILNQDKEYIPYDFLILRKLEGKNLESEWKGLEPSQQDALLLKASSMLKEIHKKTYPFFGELAGSGPLPRTSTWIEFVEYKFNYLLRQAHHAQIFTQDQQQQFINFFDKNKSVLSSVNTSHLLHGDFHPGNLLYTDSNITGVVDFEWAVAGDPLMDYLFWLSSHEIAKTHGKQFLKVCGFSDNDTEAGLRISIYQTLQNIELCRVAQLHFSQYEAATYKELALVSLECSGDQTSP